MDYPYRILVFGSICSGKTFFVKKLHAKLELPVVHLDDWFWYGEWENIGKQSLLENVCKFIDENEYWIIDGNYAVIRDTIWQHCTHIYYFHNALPILIARAVKRSFCADRTGVPVKVRENSNLREPAQELIYEILRYHFRKKPGDMWFCKSVLSMNGNLRMVKGSDLVIQKEIQLLIKGDIV